MDELFSKNALGLYAQAFRCLKQSLPFPPGYLPLIAEAMKQHPEFDPYWLSGETAFAPQEIDGYIVNPLVHIGLHVAVEFQLSSDQPAEIRTTHKALLAKGLSPHEAVHQIARVWGNLYFRNIRRSEAFDEAIYVIELEQLTLSDP